MAVSKVETRGRPFYVAEMPGVSKTSSRIYDDFYQVMRNINYPNRPCKVFSQFLEDMKYPERPSRGQIISDFVAGMSDNFALDCFRDLFTVQAVV